MNLAAFPIRPTDREREVAAAEAAKDKPIRYIRCSADVSLIRSNPYPNKPTSPYEKTRESYYAQRGKLSDEAVHKAVKARPDGISVAELCAECHLSRGTVFNVLLRNTALYVRLRGAATRCNAYAYKLA